MPNLSERLRRMYRELVQGRTTVRVVPAAEVKLDVVPIFLIGVFRSGTTLLRYIVDSHSRICCPPESNFMRALAELITIRENREGLRWLGFDEEHVLAKTREFAAFFFTNYARSVQKTRWADKTPGYVEYLSFLERLFPDAQYVMIYRHGLDVAHSICATHAKEQTPQYLSPYMPDSGDKRLAAAAYWSACTRKMLEFEATHTERCHAIRYEELCRTPETILKAMFSFLGESWEPQVLEPHRFKHDRGLEDGRARSTRGFSISQGNYLEWPRQTVTTARQAAEPMLTRLRYRVDCM